MTAVRRVLGESLGRAFGGGTPHGRFVLGAALVYAVAIFAMGWLRHETFHARNFDMAFYARLAWGIAHFDAWEPILNAHSNGLHFVWAFYPLGFVGALLGQVNTLLAAQALAVGAAAVPIARIAARHAPPGHAERASAIAAVLFLLAPNLSHAPAVDFHPGTLAVLPLAWLADAIDRQCPDGFLWAALGVLACREDLALFIVAGALPFLGTGPRTRRAVFVALGSAIFAFAYLLLFLFVVHPRFAPPGGSLELHFGHLGEGGTAGLVHTLLTDPMRLVRYVLSGGRIGYLAIVSAPWLFLAWLAPERLVPAMPLLAMNLLSQFPTTLHLDSHYLTPAMPFIVSASIVGGRRLVALGRIEASQLGVGCLVAVLMSHVAVGGSPLGLACDRLAMVRDPRAAGLARAVQLVPEDASVQAPERMLAHFAERRVLTRPPPPEQRTDVVIFDAWHRVTHRHRESLLRTEEEPILRAWLARDDHEVLSSLDEVFVLRRGGDPRTALRAHFVPQPASARPRRLTACLTLLEAKLEGRDLILVLRAEDACPSDLALRIGTGYRPRRVDLLCGGAFSPVHLRPGDVLESRHVLTDPERTAIAQDGLRVGALRESGARPDPGDPAAIDVALAQAP